MKVDIVPGNRKVLWAPIYDSARYATAGQAELGFFAIPYGQPTGAHTGAGNKTKLDTNLLEGGKLSRGQSLNAQAIRVKVKSTDVTVVTNYSDMQKILNNGVLTLKVSGSVKIEQQLCDFTGGVGAAGFAMTTVAATSMHAATNGEPNPSAIYKLFDYPINLLEGQTIECVISFPTVTAITTAHVITVQLDGVLSSDIVA